MQNFHSETVDDRMQNRTIEERVAILEFQVDNINSDISDLEQNLIVVEDEQEVQDQEIVELQLKTDGKRSQDNQITYVEGSQSKE